MGRAINTSDPFTNSSNSAAILLVGTECSGGRGVAWHGRVKAASPNTVQKVITEAAKAAGVKKLRAHQQKAAKN